jgi:hypothetical protein
MKTKNEKPLPKMTPQTAPQTAPGIASRKAALRRPDPNALLGPDGQIWALPGALCVQWRRCGKPSCRCAPNKGGALHGPYWYRCYRFSGGRQVRFYVRPAEVEATRAACAAWQALKADVRENRKRNALALRLMKQYVRSVESRAA